MATMTIRLPSAKHQRLRRLAERNGVSLNKLVDDGPAWRWRSSTLRRGFWPVRHGAGMLLALLRTTRSWGRIGFAPDSFDR